MRDITAVKDKRIANLMRHLSLLNLVALILIVVAFRFALPEMSTDQPRTYLFQAAATFLSGAMLGSLIYGTRRSAVVLRLQGVRQRFRATWPIALGILFTIGSFVSGSYRFATGMTAAI